VVRRVVVTVVTLTIVVVYTNRSFADDRCRSEAADLRRQLQAESHRAEVWNTAWALGFAGSAIGQLGLLEAEVNPLGPFDDRFRDAMYVGMLKSSLGMASRVVLPLRIAVPPRVDDPCDDVRALRHAIQIVGRKERRSVWLTLIGGTAVNLAGSIFLWARHDFTTGATSFLTAIPVTPLLAWTQPRDSARLERRHRIEWTIGVGTIGGRF
jgi:hypothetical protein